MSARPVDRSACVIEKVAEAKLPTEIGDFRIIGLREQGTDRESIAVIKGELNQAKPCLVRIHSQCMTGDALCSIRCDCGRQLRRALEIIEQAGRGIIIYEQQEGRGIGILNKIRAYALQDQGLDTVEANLELGFAADERSYDQSAAVLRFLGLKKIRLLSNNPSKINALRNAGLKVVERVPLEVQPPKEATEYLRVKKEKLGHLLSIVVEQPRRTQL